MKRTNEYSGVPADYNTSVIAEHNIEILGIRALYQVWYWQGVVGNSVIFSNKLVAGMSDKRIKKMVCDFILPKACTEMTLSRTQGFVFVNCNFFLCG